MFWKILRLLRCGLKEFGIFGVWHHFQLYRGDQFGGGGSWREPHPGQATGKLYYLRLRVECTHFLGANPRRIGDRLV